MKKKKRRKQRLRRWWDFNAILHARKGRAALSYSGNDTQKQCVKEVATNNQLNIHELARGDSWTLNTLNVVIQQSTRHTTLN